MSARHRPPTSVRPQRPPLMPRHQPPSMPYMPPRPQSMSGSQGDIYLVQMLLKHIAQKDGRVNLNQQMWQQFYKSVGCPPPPPPASDDVSSFLRRFPYLFDFKDSRKGYIIVTARINLGLCKDHFSKDGCRQLVCDDLHCCKFFLLEKCKFKTNCKYGHDLKDQRNQILLQKHFLNLLEPHELGRILKLSSKAESILPKICKFYNVDEGCRHGDDGTKCRAMHVCRHYVYDDCNFGRKCKRSHDIFAPQPKTVLVKHGINVDRSPKEVLTELQTALGKEEDEDEDSDASSASSISLGKLHLDSSARRTRSSSSDSSGPAEKQIEICTFHLRGKCSFGKACHRYHSMQDLPYQWQYRLNGSWRDFEKDSNEEIELNYCDCQETEGFMRMPDSGVMVVNYEKMKYMLKSGDSDDVRRLSTKSLVGSSSSYLYLTLWCWYWKNDLGEWKPYDKKDSFGIEEEYESNPKSHYVLSSMGCTLDLENMKQFNNKTKTISDIRRRPEMFDPTKKKPRAQSESEDRSEDIVGSPSNAASSNASMEKCIISTQYPDTWDFNQQSDNDYFQILLVNRHGNTAAEFNSIESLFQVTMPGIPLKSVKRIQNVELWDAFHRKRIWMEKKGTKLNIQQLFHGTKELLVDAICQQGFDFRMSGTSVGTLYGKGSYFAKKASYSKDYTNCRKMFVVRVIVGEYARGKPTMVRPPPKDERKPYGELYDSCVDNVEDPNIFVIFAQEQVYPEYLIEY